MSAGLITAGLGLITPWLLPVAALIDGFVFEGLTGCTTDPPPMPSSAALDLRNAIGGYLNPNYNQWLTDVHNLLLNYFWQQYCQCVTGTATTPVYPPAPPGVQVPLNPGASVCFQGSYSGPAFQETAPPFPNTPTALPPGAQVVHDGPPGNTTGTQVTAGVYSNVVTTAQYTFQPTGIRDGAIRYVFWDSAGTFISLGPLHLLPFQANGGTISGTFVDPIPANAAFINLTAATFSVDPVTPTINSLTTTFYCGGQGPGSAQPPCVTDPAVLEILRDIQKMLALIYQGLPQTLHSFSESTVHSGLTGSGHFALGANTIAVRVTFTPGPVTGSNTGDPTAFFDVGWLTTSTAEGNYRSRRIMLSPQIFMLDPLADTVHYTLFGGVVATITELTRGP